LVKKFQQQIKVNTKKMSEIDSKLMEVNAWSQKALMVCTYEAIGTGLLVYAINLSSGGPYAAFGISFMIFALVLIAGPISGAHFNPAVTLAV
jgi:glycerol uptake facilitator-like aquaporin